MPDNKPSFWKPEISTGNIISWMCAIFIAGGSVFVLKYQVDGLLASNAALQLKLEEYRSQIEQRIAAIEQQTNQKLDALSNQTSQRVGTMDAALNELRVTIAEVRGSIQAIDRDTSNISKNLEMLQNSFNREVRLRRQQSFLYQPESQLGEILEGDPPN